MVKPAIILLAAIALVAACFPAVMGLRIEERFDTKVGPTCKFCKSLVKELFSFLRENRTEESVREALDKICPLVFNDENKIEQCEHFISAYTRELVEILVDETDPELICMLLNQCVYEVKKEKVIVDDEPAIISSEANQVVGLSEFISLLDPSITSGSARTCIECKLFITYLQDSVKNPKSQDDIKEWLLKNLCDSLEKEELKSSCRNMVNTNAKAFFEAIASQLNPKVTCVEFGACRKGLFLIDNLLPIRKPVEETPVVKSSETPLADKFYKTIESMLEPMSEKPEPAADAEATLMMASLAKEIDDLQAQGKNIYSDSTPSPSPTGWQTQVDYLKKATICEQCIQIVTKLDEYISSHSIEHDVDVLVDQVCNKIPQEDVKKQCTVIVQTFGESIIEAISTMKNPQQLCSRVMLC